MPISISIAKREPAPTALPRVAEQHAADLDARRRLRAGRPIETRGRMDFAAAIAAEERREARQRGQRR